MIGAKPLRIRFDKIDEFTTVYDGTRYLVLLRPKRYDPIYNKIRYLLSPKSVVSHIFFLSYPFFRNIFANIFSKVKVDSYDSLALNIDFKYWNTV